MEPESVSSGSSPAPANACTACQHGKRRCDRALPSCSTCSKVRRLCIYDDDLITHVDHQTIPLLNLQQPTADIHSHMRTIGLSILSSVDKVYTMSRAYFDSTHYRLAVISDVIFYKRLPDLFVSASADFTTLCLCMHLIQQSPSSCEESVMSLLYGTIKTSISLLDAVECYSLTTIQCRLIVALYEMGHGIYPGASVSIGACARAARNLGLHHNNSRPVGSASERIICEERRRTWWAVHNLDRYINLCGGDAIFASEDASVDDFLPSKDCYWSQSTLPGTRMATVSTPATFMVGHFARECQVSHLVGRVVQHVFNPMSDVNFHSNEALQLERTLMSFLPILIEEELNFGKYCGALAMCLISLFILHISPSLRPQDRDTHVLPSIETLTSWVSQLTEHLLELAQDEKNKMILSPYVPYALYQTASSQLRLWQQRNEIRYKEEADAMVTILRYFNRRWLIAGKYLIALTSTEPSIALFLQGFQISNRKSTRIDQT
ncbi:hypothetical protein F5884DRAFT_340117 [Xylogone sp. PMI_703]|nr:hypothetical protein F5884DRAFT_340117 [Xylogone sp. PMI_703]